MQVWMFLKRLFTSAKTISFLSSNAFCTKVPKLVNILLFSVVNNSMN